MTPGFVEQVCCDLVSYFPAGEGPVGEAWLSRGQGEKHTGSCRRFQMGCVQNWVLDQCYTLEVPENPGSQSDTSRVLTFALHYPR